LNQHNKSGCLPICIVMSPTRLSTRGWPRVYESGSRPHSQAREIETQFQRLFHITPLDLQENAEDLVYFLKSGFRIEQLLIQPR